MVMPDQKWPNEDFSSVTRAEMADIIATIVLPAAKAMVGAPMWLLASHVVVCLRHAQPTMEEKCLMHQLQAWVSCPPDFFKETNLESFRQKCLMIGLSMALNNESAEFVRNIIIAEFATEYSLPFLLEKVRK